MAVPPDMLTFAFGAGEAVRDDWGEDDGLRGDKASEMRCPAADGGGLEVIGWLVAAALSVISGI